MDILNKTGAELVEILKGNTIWTEKIKNITEIPLNTGYFGVFSSLNINEGDIIEIYGKHSTYKSLLSLLLAQNYDENGGILYIDVTKDLNIEQISGLNLKNLLIYQPITLKEVFNLINSLENSVKIIILDTISSLLIQNSDYFYTNRELNKLKKLLKSYKTTLIYIKQYQSMQYIRKNVQQNIRNFAPELQLTTSIENKIEYDNEYLGSILSIHDKKSNNTINIDILNTNKVWEEALLFRIALNKGIIIQKGNWYFYKEVNLGNGYYNSVKTFSEKNIEIYHEIKNLIS